MPTPPKPAKVLKMEGRSHRTKSELRQREKFEKDLLTGTPLKEKREVKTNEIAHKEFLRIMRLLKQIEKNDDLYSNPINRYCELYAECVEFEEKREKFFEQLCNLQDRESELIDSKEMTIREFYNIQDKLQKNLLKVDAQIQQKRKMMLDLEKENVMTIASALRSIPKAPDKKKNPLAEALNG